MSGGKEGPTTADILIATVQGLLATEKSLLNEEKNEIASENSKIEISDDRKIEDENVNDDDYFDSPGMVINSGMNDDEFSKSCKGGNSECSKKDIKPQSGQKSITDKSPDKYNSANAGNEINPSVKDDGSRKSCSEKISNCSKKFNNPRNSQNSLPEKPPDRYPHQKFPRPLNQKDPERNSGKSLSGRHRLGHLPTMPYDTRPVYFAPSGDRRKLKRVRGSIPQPMVRKVMATTTGTPRRVGRKRLLEMLRRVEQ